MQRLKTSQGKSRQNIVLNQYCSHLNKCMKFPPHALLRLVNVEEICEQLAVEEGRCIVCVTYIQ